MTKKIGQGGRIRYDEGCLAAHALNLIGDRWALLVVRELIFAPKRFQMIRAGLPGITASVLTARLEQLCAAGIITHDRRLGTYRLTEAGQGLLPVLESLCRWALIMPGHDPSRFISPTALMISMRVNLQRSKAEAAGEMLAGFDFGQEAFEARLRDGILSVQVAEQPRASFILRGNGNAMAGAIYGPVPLAALAERQVVLAEGDLAAAQDFIDLFQLAPQS